MQSENGISNWNLKIQKNPKITKSREKNPNFFFHPKYGLWGLKSKGMARGFISSDKRPQKPRKNRSNFAKKKKKKKRKIIISANFSQTQKVRLLGFRKFQVFSPNRGDAKLFQKTVKSNLDNNLRKFCQT